MEIIRELLAPLLANASWSFPWTIFNTALHIAGIATLTALLYRASLWVKEKRNKGSSPQTSASENSKTETEEQSESKKASASPENSSSRRKSVKHKKQSSKKQTKWELFRHLLGKFYHSYFWPLFFALLVYGALPALFSFNYYYDPSCPFNFLLDGLYAFLDILLHIGKLLDDPFINLPSANIIARLSIVIGYFWLGIFVWRSIRKWCNGFSKFLKEHSDKEKEKKYGMPIVIGFTVSVCTTTGISVLSKAEEPLNLLSSGVDWIVNALRSLFTLVTDGSMPTNFDELIVGLLAILLSVCGLLLIIGMLYAFALFIAFLINNAPTVFKDLLDTIKENLTNFLCGIAMAVLIFIGVLIVILTLMNIPAIVEWLGNVIGGSPDTLLKLFQNTGLFIAGLTLCVLIAGFAVTTCRYCRDMAKEWIAVNKDGHVIRSRNKVITTVFLSAVGLILLCFVFFWCFPHVYGWISAICAPETSKMFPVVGSIILAVLLILGSLLLFALLLGLTGSAGWQLFRVFFCGEKLGLDIFKGVWEKILHLLKGIFLVFVDTCHTIFSIIRGYRNESEKNAAVFVAASFASLASFVNTFCGLLSFNNNNGAITVFTSLAIAFAVQLAMLIFGMKAGQAMAEDMVINAGVFKRGKPKLIFNRIMVFLLQIMTIASCTLAVYSFVAENSSLTICLWIAAALFFFWSFGILIVNICSLCKNTDKEQSNTSLPKSTRRVSAWLYFAAYILLMIVSTSFAYNNLFNAYATATELHGQVYNEVQAQSEQQIIEELDELVSDYIDNQEALKTNLKIRYSNLKDGVEKLHTWQAGENPNNQIPQLKKTLQLNSIKFNLDDVYESMIRIIDSDVSKYDSVKILTYGYSFFPETGIIFSSKAVIITNGSDTIEIGKVIAEGLDDSQKNSFYSSITTDEQEPSGADKLKDSAFVTPLHEKVYVSTDNIQIKELSDVSKYQLIAELWKIFELMEEDAYSFTVLSKNVGTENGDTSFTPPDNEEYPSQKGDPAKDRGYLIELQNLELVFNQLKKLRTNSDDNPSANGETGSSSSVNGETGDNLSVLELHRIVSDYLNDSLGSQNTDGAYNKKEELKKLENYVTCALTINNILGGAEQLSSGNTDGGTEPTAPIAVTGETTPPDLPDGGTEPTESIAVTGQTTPPDLPDGGTEPTESIAVTGETTPPDLPDGGTEPTESIAVTGQTTPQDLPDSNQESPTDRRMKLQTYLSYARSLTNSDLLLSYDTLFRGAFTLNPTKNYDDGFVINALYSAQTVAIFILLICALIDLMAFFAGLLLFQNAFLISFGNKTQKSDDISKPEKGHHRNKGNSSMESSESDGGKASELGFLALDAMLTNHFMPPDEKGHTRTYRLALIYCCQNMIEANNIDESDEQLMANLKNVNLFTLKRMLESHNAMLNEYGLTASDIAVWLNSFVAMNGIELDEIINTKADSSQKNQTPVATH